VVRLGRPGPAGDGVRVLGLNGDWSIGVTMVPSSADANIYTVTNSLPVSGAWPNYKFVITPTSSPWIWESPANFGGGNRYFPVPAGGTNLPVGDLAPTPTTPIASSSATTTNLH